VEEKKRFFGQKSCVYQKKSVSLRRKTQKTMETNQIPRWEQKLESYTKALSRLAHVVNESKRRQLNEFELDSVVQRFEFTHEIAWKLMKSYAEFQGEQTLSGSRDACRWAFENHLIDDGQIWMDMIRSRNETSHVYDDAVAASTIQQIIQNYFPAMVAFQEKIAKIATSTPKDLFSQQ